MEREQKFLILRTFVSIVLLAMAHFLPYGFTSVTVICALAYVIISYDVFAKLPHADFLDEQYLMVIASLGAFALGIIEKSGDYSEAVIVMTLYRVGELFEDNAVEKSRRNVTELLDVRPDRAFVLNPDGSVTAKHPSDVLVGEIISVKPGERIPLDGCVVRGVSSVDNSALTGESLPQNIEISSAVYCGSVNLTGLIEIKVSKKYSESTVSEILRLVEESDKKKAKAERFITRFAQWYTPVVCSAAVVIAVLLPIITGGNWLLWLKRALTLLVISCPCALVISIPLSFYSCIGGAGKKGILIKGSEYIETLASVKNVVFDKTGTLTLGDFEVSGYTDEKTLELAAYAESSSTHPIALSIVKAYGKKIDTSRIGSVEEIAGNGVRAVVDSDVVLVGNAGFAGDGRHFEPGVVFVSVNGGFRGYVRLSDSVKESSALAVENLRNLGIERIVMLSGDEKSSVEAVASKVGISEFRSSLLPADKVSFIKGLEGTSAFAGDGINDAPVLVSADVGIAMGALGSDAAIEAADVVLMDDNPAMVAEVIRMARKCMHVVRQNIIFACAVKFICLVCSSLGLTGMGFAVFADTGVMVLAVLNAVRMLRFK